ncbi:DUF1684 domain-containing protein [Neomegalonema sp.]|uniref:DUF1684 domain-containing protein n=1 Tax=Neomegalonema sp. TaxID=2039713 RepID=UPI002615058F|nr:DUF1684 domain-containing protein [Neomegalonema sp.]MDD2867794.1 DUF1684 domain-containing protein [Neomegalonema sp.]
MSFAEDHAAWAAARLAALKAEDGWLHLTDRVEISPGRHEVGRGEEAEIRISAGPERLGVLTLGEDGSAALDAGAGPLAFVAAPEGTPQLRTGGLLLEISTLEGQAALRVRDLTDPAREAFAEIPAYPPDPAWRILADWEKLPEAEDLRIGTVTGVETSARITHRARFLHEGREVALLPTHWKKGKPMFVIRDATSGRETYGASRFLIGEPEGDRIVLDFNRAFNPPCAFTDFAVCPLPPRENILPFPIRAGEKKLA